MRDSIEIQLSFNEAAYPCATRALRGFGSARNRADYLKSILETHFKALEDVRNRTCQDEPRHIAPQQADGQHQGLSGELNSQDVNHAFSSYFK
ncbi:hypothetical protein PTE30175_02542 [Pandoraea terrae]|uniref:Uncharacterized protein n=1 Tax=Pandoraea terrae TaxID=1537710 RepID=A0A5E4VEH3_9BURK|nr:hypothetical protein PTE30175_02542 [Pandoraea terrae]